MSGSDGAEPGEPASEPVPVRSYVALLKELCDTFLLPAVDYELVRITEIIEKYYFSFFSI